jgi:hypothetical protein
MTVKVSKAVRDPAHRHAVLQKERALQALLFGKHSEEEIAAAARALGVEHMLPEPQRALPLERIE